MAPGLELIKGDRIRLRWLRCISPLLAHSGPHGMPRSDVRFRGLSRHHNTMPPCPLMTQSGHCENAQLSLSSGGFRLVSQSRWKTNTQCFEPRPHGQCVCVQYHSPSFSNMTCCCWSRTQGYRRRAEDRFYLERATVWRDLLASRAGSFHVFSTLPLSFDLIALGVEVVE
jgi:hypothetical protein